MVLFFCCCVFWCFFCYLFALFLDSSRFSASIASIFVEKHWFWTIFGRICFFLEFVFWILLCVFWNLGCTNIFPSTVSWCPKRLRNRVRVGIQVGSSIASWAPLGTGGISQGHLEEFFVAAMLVASQGSCPSTQPTGSWWARCLLMRC